MSRGRGSQVPQPTLQSQLEKMEQEEMTALLTNSDFSSLDISICQLSRRWQPSLGGCKKFEPSLRPGKSSYG